MIKNFKVKGLKLNLLGKEDHQGEEAEVLKTVMSAITATKLVIGQMNVTLVQEVEDTGVVAAVVETDQEDIEEDTEAHPDPAAETIGDIEEIGKKVVDIEDVAIVEIEIATEEGEENVHIPQEANKSYLPFILFNFT